MPTITIVTSGRNVSLDNDEAMDLLEHVRQDAGEHCADSEGPLLNAINSQGAYSVRWTPDGKQGALNAIIRWLVGGDDATEGIRELEDALMSDLNAAH